MKAIQKELGEDEPSVEIDEIRNKVDEAGMPDDVNKVAMKELKRLKKYHLILLSTQYQELIWIG